MCEYVCTCEYVCMCEYAFVCIYVCACMRVSLAMYEYVVMCVCDYVYVYVCGPAFACGGIYVYAPDLSDFDTVELCSDKCVGVKSSFFETVAPSTAQIILGRRAR